MRKVLATITGRDGPGIVHKVSQALSEKGCALAELAQTTLLGQFAGLFSAESPDGLGLDELSAFLSAALAGTGLRAWVAPADEAEAASEPADPYVLTLAGPKRPELVLGVTKTVASFGINIDSLRALTLSESSGPESSPAVLALEISVPRKVGQKAFRQALALTAEELGVEASLQHRDIFEAIHRI
jgi:glycine cleavage system transcriptional repressor